MKEFIGQCANSLIKFLKEFLTWTKPIKNVCIHIVINMNSKMYV